MSQRDDILVLAGEARPVIERWLEIGEQIAAFRDLATEKQIKWSQLKAVLVASIKDVDGGKRLQKLADTADNLLLCADILLNPKGANRKEIKYPDRSSPTKQSPSAVPIPDTTSRDGGAAAPAATSGKSTAAAEGALNSPQPDGAPSTNSAIETAALSSPHLHGRIEPDRKTGFSAVSTLPDDDCIPTFLDRTAELRA